MQRILIDYPPGGLGNFIAQVRINSLIDPDSIQPGSMSFHQRAGQNYYRHEYDISWLGIAPMDRESRLSGPPEHCDHDTVLVHSWGQGHRIAQHMGCDGIWHVRVQHCRTALFLNWWLKASRGNIDALVQTDTIKNHPRITADMPSTVLQRFACWYHVVHQHQWQPWVFSLPCYPVAKVVEFDRFYGTRSGFCRQIQEINPDIDSMSVYELFQRSQGPILQRLSDHDRVIRSIQQQEHAVAIPNSWTPIDHALLMYQLDQIYPGVDFLAPELPDWFQNTRQIRDILISTLI